MTQPEPAIDIFIDLAIKLGITALGLGVIGLIAVFLGVMWFYKF